MCRDEVEEILSNGKTELEWNDMNSLVFTTQFIKETLRLFPVVPNIHREINSDTQLHGTVLPKGAWAFIDILCLHHNPLVWDDPEEFRPSRFSSENSKKRHPYAYIPFSAGSRNCIGQNFALNEERVAIAMTVYRYELIELSDHPADRLINVILKPHHDITIQLKPIKR
jgi:cytochrome P450